MIVTPPLQSSRKEEMEFEARLSQIVLDFVGKKKKKKVAELTDGIKIFKGVDKGI